MVEMLVAMTIFVIVVTIASTIFVHAIRAQRLNLAYQELLDQTSYVMEYMSRSIRMAMKDDIEIWGFVSTPPGCLAGINKENYEFDVPAQCLKFRNYKNECQYFCLQGATLLTATTTPTIPPVFTALTSPELQVSPLGAQWVELFGETQADTDQPRVTILLQIEGREGARIQIRTSISQRNLDTFKP